MAFFTQPTAYVYTFDAATGSLTSELMRVPGGRCTRSPSPSGCTLPTQLPTLGKDTQGLIEEVLIRRGEVVYFVEKKGAKAPKAVECESEKENRGEQSGAAAKAVRRAMREVRTVELMARELEEALAGAGVQGRAGSVLAGRGANAEDEEEEDEDESDDEDDDDEEEFDSEIDDEDDESVVSDDEECEVELEECEDDDDECDEDEQAVQDRAVELFGDEDDWEAALFGTDEDSAAHMDVEDIEQDSDSHTESNAQANVEQVQPASQDEDKPVAVGTTDVSRFVEQWTRPEDWQTPIMPLPSTEFNIFAFGFGAEAKTAMKAEDKGQTRIEELGKNTIKESDSRTGTGTTSKDADDPIAARGKTDKDCRSDHGHSADLVPTKRARRDSRADLRMAEEDPRADTRMATQDPRVDAGRADEDHGADRGHRADMVVADGQRTNQDRRADMDQKADARKAIQDSSADGKDRRADVVADAKGGIRTKAIVDPRADARTRTRTEADVDPGADPRIRADKVPKDYAWITADQSTGIGATARADQRTNTADASPRADGSKRIGTGNRMTTIQRRIAAKDQADLRTTTDPEARARMECRADLGRRADVDKADGNRAVEVNARVIVDQPMARTGTSTARRAKTEMAPRAASATSAKGRQACKGTGKKPAQATVTKTNALAEMATTRTGSPVPGPSRGKKRKAEDDDDATVDPRPTNALPVTKTLSGLKFKKMKTCHSILTTAKNKTVALFEAAATMVSRRAAADAGMHRSPARQDDGRRRADLKTGTTVRWCLDGDQRLPPRTVDGHAGRKRKNDERDRDDDKEEGEISDSEDDVPLAKRLKSMQVSRAPTSVRDHRGAARARSDYETHRQRNDRRHFQLKTTATERSAMTMNVQRKPQAVQFGR
ncbi:hypothetical protein BV20DRAFT_1057502 [Pilatotrama ljubarskyi]|nr:hypothetical protein BV20DRAFT_1057502 [Pilatotrama ljubarskyi]